MNNIKKEIEGFLMDKGKVANGLNQIIERNGATKALKSLGFLYL